MTQVTVQFGRKDEPLTTFEKSTDLIAVRTRSKRSLRGGPVASPAAEDVQDGKLVLTFPEAGVEVYQVPTTGGAKSVAERKAVLSLQPDVRFAGGVLVDEVSAEPVVYTENLFIKFVDDADPMACRLVLQEAGLLIKQEVEYARNAFFTSAQEGTGLKIFDLAQQLLQRPDVEYCHPEVLRQARNRAIAAQQWHLKNATVNGQAVTASANVEEAHTLTQGLGTTIAIIDTGIDIDHPEFQTVGKIVAPRDATLGTANPRPVYKNENHGTACAGVACADGRQGAAGVAPLAKLMPIRLQSILGSQQEASAFMWAAQNGADVISCSWGPQDGKWWDATDPGHHQRVPMPASTRLAIDYAVSHGRGGRGCVVLFAAGNGNESVSNDGYASYDKVIAVAACNDRGVRSAYSDYGPAIWCSFPSNDFGWPQEGRPEPLTAGIWTTDQTGPRGYNVGGALEQGSVDGNYTNSFGGTSSAAPGAAGVAALILSADPELSSEQVRAVMRESCEQIDAAHGQYDADGRSPWYGYGRLNAARAVRIAQDRLKVRLTAIGRHVAAEGGKEGTA